jgi:CDP-glucose 4,6-dehydratase
VAAVNASFWRGKRVLLTGHTGFKGAWAAIWLVRMGARVTGLALPPDQVPSLFELAGVEALVDSRLVDLRDRAAVAATMAGAQFDIVLHLAAQPIVRASVEDPIGTFASNIMGTAHLLDALRGQDRLRGLLVVTSDKVYANAEAGRPFAEGDALGGKDPYSASKAATEIVTASFAKSFFEPAGVPVATARGGNVIGGGDWSEDRLIPDIVRTMNAGKPLVLRNPKAVRPWQHVLELINGYLTLGHLLLEDPARAEGAWNFGPERSNEVEVGTLARAFGALYSEKGLAIDIQPSALAEAGLLKLDIAKATSLLPWKPMLDFEQTIALTADWYRDFHRGGDAAALVKAQIAGYADRLDA